MNTLAVARGRYILQTLHTDRSPLSMGPSSLKICRPEKTKGHTTINFNFIQNNAKSIPTENT